MTPTTITIVVAEDHTLVRQSLVKLLSGEPDIEVVGETGRGDEAQLMIERLGPDVGLLDIEMPGATGLEVAAALEEHPVGIVLLTMHDDAATVRRATDVGAEGYLSKTASTDEVLTAVRSVAAGGSYLSPEIAAKVMRLAGREGDGTNLTDREREILELLSSGKRVADIAGELYLSTKTVKNHLTNVYAKLEVQTAAQAVAEAYRRGLVRAS